MVGLRAQSEPDRVVGVDMEWDVHMFVDHNRRKTSKRSVVQTVQLARKSGEMLIIRVGKMKKLPRSLVSLFADATITKIGVNVKGDFTRLKKDYSPQLNVRSVIDVGHELFSRGCAPNARSSLLMVMWLVFGFVMDKDGSVRVSNKWSRPTLTERQILYEKRVHGQHQ